MTDEEIEKKLNEINECMKELQEAKFQDAPRDIIYELQQKIDSLIRENTIDEDGKDNGVN